MASWHLLTGDDDTNAGGTNTRAVTFTPTVGDLIVVVTSARGINSAFFPAVTCDNGLTLSRISVNTTQWIVRAYVSDQAVTSAVLHTLTVDHTGDATTGQNIHVFALRGMSRVGLSSVRTGQEASTNIGTAGTTPACTFPAACLTGNPVLTAVSTGAAAPVSSPPSGWTELTDSGFTTPSNTLAVTGIDSGFTSSTVTYGATITTEFSVLAVEFDASSTDNGEGAVWRGVGCGIGRAIG